MAAGVLKTVTAPMPLIVLQDKDVQLKLLRNFDASEQRKTRSDKAASEILGTFGGVTIESFLMNQRDRVTRLFRSRKGFVPHKQFQSTAA